MSRDKLRILMMLAFVAGCVYFLFHYTEKLERRDRAEQFVRKYIRLVQANDLQNAYYQCTSERFRKIYPFAKFSNDYNVAFRKVGELRSYKVEAWFEPTMGKDYYQLDCLAQYQNDSGALRFVLDADKDSFLLSGFFLYSSNWEKLKETPGE